MAGRARKPVNQSRIPRTIERMAIAALAAIATRGSGKSIAFVAVTIFIILVVIEEFDRRWIWQGERVTLRDVAFSTIGLLRLQRAEFVERRKGERRRSRSRRRRSKKAVDQAHALRGKVSQ